MDTTKLKIDLSNGTIEAEGSEEFVREIYAEFKSKLELNIQSRRQTLPKPQPKKCTPFSRRFFRGATVGITGASMSNIEMDESQAFIYQTIHDSGLKSH